MSEHIAIKVGDTIDAAKRELLVATLNHHKGDKVQAAMMLGVSLKTIYNLMRRYRIRLAFEVTPL